MAAGPFFPKVWIDLPRAVAVPLVLPPGGLELTFTLPRAPHLVVGVDLLVQAMCFSPNAANGLYAATDLHELRVR